MWLLVAKLDETKLIGRGSVVLLVRVNIVNLNSVTNTETLDKPAYLDLNGLSVVYDRAFVEAIVRLAEYVAVDAKVSEYHQILGQRARLVAEQVVNLA